MRLPGEYPRRRRSRDLLIDAGFALGDRLAARGRWPHPGRVRRGLAGLIGDLYLIETGGALIGGSLVDHGSYLHYVAVGGLHPLQRRLYVDAVEPGSVVVDCGAHIGVHAVLAGRRTGPGGRVFAIEPAPPNLGPLRANVAANGLAENVDVIDGAASDSSGTETIYLHTELDQSGMTLVAERFREAVEVRRVVLDEVLDGRRVDVLKVDVEGAEALVLDGLRETLERSRGAAAFIECHPPKLAEAGTDPAAWAAELRERGRLELIDEESGRLVPASEDELARVLGDLPQSFNLRWTVG